MKTLTDSLLELIKIPSIKSDGVSDGAPFGKEIRQALDYCLDLGGRMGFVTRDFDGYAGEIEFGSGDKVLGILAHLDVVPIGSGWTKEQGVIEDGVIYGRGAVDDKGPALAVLYAMKELLDEGFSPSKTVRLILGCDEESGSKCMDYYQQIGRMPDEGFSPDSDFPIVMCEKTIMQARLDIDASQLAAAGVRGIKGGHRVNMVPDFAELTLKEDGGVKRYDFEGKSAHGSTPQEGDNAVWKLFGFLERRFAGIKLIADINKYLMCGDALNNSGLYIKDDNSGEQTLNVGKVSYDEKNKTLRLLLDFRCPISQDIDKIKSVLTKLIAGAVFTVEQHKPYLYADPESELVRGLLSAYREITGDDSPGKIIGGGTYARSLKNGVAFGPTFDGQKTRIHDADEQITVDNLIKAKDIYKLAIKKLCQ